MTARAPRGNDAAPPQRNRTVPDAQSHPDQTPARPRSRPLLPIVVALACIGGQTAQLAHFLLVRHERCAAHDTLSHGDHAHHDHGALPDDPSTAARSVQAQDLQAHDDCTVIGHLREPAVSTAPVQVSLPLQAPPPRTLAPPRAPTLAVTAALWLVAPKNSPPV